MNSADNHTLQRSLIFWEILFCSLLLLGAPAPSMADSPLMLTYQPPRGFAGVTVVYISGWNFGSAQSAGTPLTIGGVDASASILMWSDGMVIAKVPDGATTGEIVVNTDHGSVTSSDAAAFQWELGTGAVSSDFIVDTVYQNKTPDSSLLQECPDVTGTWTLDDGYGTTASYVIESQDSNKNSDGTVSISGFVDWIYYYGDDGSCEQNFTGTLNAGGNLVFAVDDDLPDGCEGYSEAYHIVNSGCDLTTPARISFNESIPPMDPADVSLNFLNNLGQYGDYPLRKVTEIPEAETFNFSAWVQIPGSESSAPTGGSWMQLPSAQSGANFGGRLVYEYDPGGGSDQCKSDAPSSPYPDFSLSGGAWWVAGGPWSPMLGQNGQQDPTPQWGVDTIGLAGEVVSWYQGYYGSPGCDISHPQAMYVGSDNQAPVNYINNTVYYHIRANTVVSGKGPAGGSENDSPPLTYP